MTSREELASDSSDRLAEAAEAFDQQLREQGDAAWPGGPTHDRIRSVLELLNTTLRPGSTQSIGASDHFSPSFIMPSRVGRFEVGPIVGQGGFGVVYRARDEVLHRDVAIKAVPRHPGASASSEDVRLREARAVARLNHPHIVPLFEVLDDENCVYLVSEFCEGPTLFEYMRDAEGPIEPAKAVEITLRIAQAISHAHDRGLVHRDIKPSNILLMTERVDGNALPFTPRLTDFGLVIETGLELSAHLPQRLAGTVNFMAPEQILGDNRWDARLGDIYSLGLLLYRMLAGRSPYQATTPVGMLEEICTKPLTKLPELNVPFASDLVAICYKAMNKEPGHRYRSARELVDDLQRWQEGREVSARKQSVFERLQRAVRREPVVASLFAALMMLAMASAVVFAWSNQRLREQSETLEQAYDLASSSEASAINTAYRSDISRAFSAAARDDSAAALSILDQVDAYIRDTHRQRFDMKLLRAIARRGWLPIATLPGAVEEIIHVPSIDGFAVASELGGVFFYRESDGKLMAHYRQPAPGKIKALAISHDGTQMAVGRGIPRRIAWISTNDQQVVDIVPLDALAKLNTNANTDQPLNVKMKSIRTLTGFDATVDSLAYSSDGRYLAVGVRYEPIEVFDLETEDAETKFVSERRNEDLSFSSNDELTWMTSKKEIMVTDVMNQQALRPITIPDEFELFRVRRSHDGQWVMCSVHHTGNLLLYLRDGTDRSPVILETTDVEIRSLNFSPGSRYAVVGTVSGAVARWDLSKIAKQLTAPDSQHSPPLRFKPEQYQGLHGTSVTSIAVSDLGKIMSGSSEGAVTLVNAEAATEATVTVNIPERSTFALASSDGRKIFLGFRDGSICALTTASRQKNVIHTAGDSMVTRLALSPDDRWLAAGFQDGHAVICDLKKTPQWNPLPFQDQEDDSPKYVWEMAFDSALKGLYINRGRCKCQWLRLELPMSGTETVRVSEEYFYHAPSSLEASVVCDDSRVITFGDTIYRFDLKSGLHHAITGIHEVRCSCLAPLTDSILVGTRDGRIRLMDKEGQTVRVSDKWKPSESSPNDSREICTIAVSSDGQNILTGSNLGDIGIWDFETLRYLGPILPANNQGYITTIQVVADSAKLIAYQQESLDTEDQGRGAVHLISSQ
jgi:eukaryotic-like serine/threonine-protein kinase